AERQKVVRLLVKEVLVDNDTITIRHSIPAQASTSPAGGAPLPSNGKRRVGDESYLLRSGSGDAALRRAARVALATTDAPGPVAFIPFLDRRFQPQLDQPEHVPVHDATSYRFDKRVMWNRVEVAG